tara:strand:- start:231 stop:1640 length:1410 start_codon:yes stop_codon:yes gene_type:complete
MLFVDLDKTLIKSDFFFESFVNYFSQNIFAPLICLLILIREGVIGLKKFLYDKSNISIENLPYNEKVLDTIHSWKEEFPEEKVYLISAAYHSVVEDVAKHLKCFDGWYGTIDENLKSKIKLLKIDNISKGEGFSYIGDSFADVIIWEKAEKSFLVNPSSRLLKKVTKITSSFEVIMDKDKDLFFEIIKAIRLHQWIKNLLIFIPTFLSLEPFFKTIDNTLFGFFAFSFIASAFYILNDLYDVENDRVHDSKKNRPFARGSLSTSQGFIIFFVLLTLSIIFSINLSHTFQLILFLYAIGTFAYTKFLKKIPILDIMTLSSFYLIRVIAGGVLASVSVSNWLLTFSVFFFLFLASVKRWVEISRQTSEALLVRGYQSSDMKFISSLSYFSGLISVLVICLYIESQQALTLYNESEFLWFIPIILLYWILEILFKVERGQVDDDPVKYALKSKTSYISLICLVIIFLFATAT